MFSVLKLQINRGSTTANAQGGDSVAITHTYKDETLTVAAIRILLPDYLGQGAVQDKIFVGDHLLVEGSDTTIYCKILSLAPFTLGTDLFSGASSLSVGPTIAAIDNNAARISGDTLQMERADATHSGVVTDVAQEIGGEKTFVDTITAESGIIAEGVINVDTIDELTGGNGTVINGANLINGGIQFLPVQTLLRTYIETTVFFSFDNGALPTAPVLFRITKIGNIVTLTALEQGITSAQATPGEAFFSTSVLNTLYRPSVAPVTGYWRVFNGVTGSIGMIKIFLSGTIAIYNNADETTTFTAGVNNIFDSGTFTYNVN